MDSTDENNSNSTAPATADKPDESKVEQNENNNNKPTDNITSDTTMTNTNSEIDHAPPLGSKIQVLWRIIHGEHESNDQKPEETEQPTNSNSNSNNNENRDSMEVSNNSNSNMEERWWGAVVQECTDEKVGSRCLQYAHLNIHLLLYDAYNEFEEEIVKVAFLPDNLLLDLSMLNDSTGGKLDWQYENSNNYNDNDNDNNICSAENLVREAEEIIEQSGISVDADLQALSTMPHSVQLHVTSGYRSFADSIKELLGELVNSKPTGYVVTVDDVQNIMARVRSQQRQRTQPMAGAL